MRATAGSQVSVDPAPLAVTQVGSLTPDSGLVFTAEAKTNAAVAEQELAAAGRQTSQLVEKFELLNW